MGAAAEPPRAVGLVSSVVNDTLEFYRWTWSIRGNAPQSGHPGTAIAVPGAPRPRSPRRIRFKMAPSPGRRGAGAEAAGGPGSAAGGPAPPQPLLVPLGVLGRCVYLSALIPSNGPRRAGHRFAAKVRVFPGRLRAGCSKTCSPEPTFLWLPHRSVPGAGRQSDVGGKRSPPVIRALASAAGGSPVAASRGVQQAK